MISNGQETLRTAGAYLGALEGPPNRSGDPIVDECQEMYGLKGVPWCACFVGYCIETSKAAAKYKAAAKQVVHPSTAVMVDRARKKGWYDKPVKYAQPGDLFIIDGLHVGFINQLLGDGTFRTLEGNCMNGVRSLTRAWRDGWRVIQFPGVGQATVAATVDGYGFDDTRVKVFGGWPTRAARDQQMKKWKAAHPDYWVQPLRIKAPSPFAFRSGPEGTWDRWTFGPWKHLTGKEIRDEKIKAWSAANEGAKARPWKKTYKEH